MRRAYAEMPRQAGCLSYQIPDQYPVATGLRAGYGLSAGKPAATVGRREVVTDTTPKLGKRVLTLRSFRSSCLEKEDKSQR